MGLDSYKVIEEYNAKIRTKGVNLELCFQGLKPTRKCFTVIEVSELDKVITNVIEFNLGISMIFIHKNIVGFDLFTFLYNTINTRTTPIIIGYREGFISAKLILKKSFKKNVVKEVDL